MKKVLNKILLIILLAFSTPVISQIDTVFWFAAPWVTVGHASNVPVVMRLSSFNNLTTVRVRQPASTFDTTFTIPANSLVSESLSHLINNIENTPANTVLNRGIKITSDFPITVVYEVVTSGNNPETYSMKGQNGMGLEFVCPFQTNGINWTFTPTAKSQIDLVATQNGTIVWITPKCAVVGHAAGVTYSIALNAGQTYNIENVTNVANVAGQNLSGTIVVSNKPICVSVTDDSVRGVSGCMDLMGDQIVPVEVVGTEYIINKGGLSAGEFEGAYIVATENFTQITINDGAVTTKLLNKGDTYYYGTTQPLTYITGDKPFYVIHASGFGCELGEAIIPPLNCAGSDQVSFTRTNTQTFILNILCKTSAKGNFLLNGSATLVPATSFSIVPGTGGLWSGAQISYTTTQIPVGITNLLRNTHPTDNLFSMGVINGGATTGCLYHYMSSFLRKVYTDAGVDKNICTASNTISLNGSVTGGSTTGIWTTPNGTGTFGNTTSLNTTYTLSANDLNQSQIKFILSSTGNCTPKIDTMLLNVYPSPIVDAGNNQTLCKNNITSIPLTGSLQLAAGANWTSSGTGSFGNSGALNTTYVPSPADLSSGSVKIKLTSTGSLNGCPNRYDSLMITFTNPPVVSVGADVSVCANNATVAINGSVSGTSTTGIWSGGIGTYNSSNTALTATYVPTPTEISSGSVKIILSSTNNGNCKQVKDSMIVTFTSAPSVSAGSDLSICKNNVATVLSGAVGGPTSTGIWSGGLGTFNPSNTGLNSIYTPSAAEIAAGSLTLTLSSTNNTNCNQVTDNVIINFTNPPVVNAGLDLSVCKNKLASILSGAVSGPTTSGIWSGGSGTFNPGSSVLNSTYTPSAAELTAGVVTLTLTSTANGNCNAVTDVMQINLTNAPTVSAGADVNSCKNNANTVLSGVISGPTTTGTWIGGSGSFNPGNSALTSTYTPSATELTAGVVTLTLTSTNNGNCNAVTDIVQINFTASPNANAGLDISACKNNPAVTLSGLVSGATTTGSWSGGAGTFNPNNSTLNSIYNPSAAELTAGSVTLTLASTGNGNCIASTDNIIINFTNPPLVNAGLDLSVCKNNSSSILSGFVSGPTSTGIWSGGSGTFNPGSSVLNSTYTPSAAELTAGVVTLTLTSTANGNCNAITDVMQINLTNAPAVSAGADVFACENNINSILTGVVSGPTTSGVWTGGAGTFNPGNSALTTTYTPTAAEIASGFVTLTLSSTNNGNCNSVNDIVQINFTGAPAVSAGTDITVCENSPTSILTGLISGPTTTGIWNGGNGTFNPSNTDLNSIYNPSAAELAAGSVTLTLTSTNNGSCNQVLDTVVINFTNAPSVNAGSDLNLCKNNASTVLTGLVNGPTSTGVWSGGSGTYNPNNSVLNATYTPSSSELSAGFANLYLTSTNNGTCNQVIDTVVISFNNAPVVLAGPDISVCANNPTVSISGSVSIGSTTGIWSGNGSGLFSPSTNSLNVTYLLSPADVAQGSVIIKLTSTNNGNCNAVYDSLIVNVTPKPMVDAGLNDTICSSNIFIPINGTITGGASSGIWSTVGNGTFGNNSNLNTVYMLGQADTTAGQVKLILTSTGGSCLPETDTVLIVISKAPFVNSGANQLVCDNQLVTLTGSINGLTNTGIWTTLGTGVFSPNDSLLTTFYQPSALDIASGSVQILLTSTYNKGCLPVKDTIDISFKTSPNADFSTNNVCVSNLATFTDLSSTPSGTITSWHWDFGDFLTSTNTSTTHQYTSGGNYTVTHVAQNANGCTDTIRKPIEIYFLPQAQFYQNVACVGNATQFTDSTKTLSGSIQNWLWNFGDGQTSTFQNPAHGFSSSITYTVSLIVTSSYGCKDTVEKTLTVVPGPNADFSINPNPVEALETVTFTDQSSGPNSLVNWYWAFGDSTVSNSQNTTHVYGSQGDYSVLLVVKDLSGCIDSVQKDISIILLPDVPTAFSPNGDGQNDLFLVRGGPFKTINVRVYNNWGQLIFETNDQLQGWDGKFKEVEQPVGVFVWVVEVEMINGKKIKETGDVTLLR